MKMDETLGFLENRDNFILSTHTNPDADGIGAIIGLIGILKKFKKTYFAVMQDKPQTKLAYLKGISEIKIYADSMEHGSKYDSAIFIDAPKLEIIGGPAKLLSENVQILNIDHHESNGHFGNINLIDSTNAASTQIIHSIYENFKLVPDPISAQALYAGLCMDTGRFRFDNTSPEVFRVAAKLVEAGAVPYESAEQLYFHSNYETKLGLAKMLSTIEIHKGGKVATAYLDYDFYNSEIGKATDTEGFVNEPLSINGVEVAILIREEKKGKTRVSLRSKNDINVNKVAGVLGGGGHPKASGCKVEGTAQEVKEKCLGILDDFL